MFLVLGSDYCALLPILSRAYFSHRVPPQRVKCFLQRVVNVFGHRATGFNPSFPSWRFYYTRTALCPLLCSLLSFCFGLVLPTHCFLTIFSAAERKAAESTTTLGSPSTKLVFAVPLHNVPSRPYSIFITSSRWTTRCFAQRRRASGSLRHSAYTNSRRPLAVFSCAV